MFPLPPDQVFQNLSKWEQYSTEELCDIVSDYHKDVHGFRPGNPELYESRDRLIETLNELDEFINSMKSTPRGRQQLRDEGWIVDEPVRNQ